MDEQEQPRSTALPSEKEATDESAHAPRLPAAESPPTGEVRIAAVQAAVAAGIAESTNAAVPPPPPPTDHEDDEESDDDEEGYVPFTPEHLAETVSESSPTRVEEEVLAAFGIPNWTDPPTGQIPRVLLEDPGAPTDLDLVPGPTWREDSSDWDDVTDHLAYLAEDNDDEVVIAGREPESETGEHDVLGLNELDAALAGALAPLEDSTAWHEVLTPEPEPDVMPDPVERRRALRRARHGRAAGRPKVAAPELPDALAPEPRSRRSPVAATLTGIALAAVFGACVLGGATSSLGLAVALLVLAAAEVFGALRRGGYSPATLIGLLAVPAMVIGAYVRGTEVIVPASAAALFACVLWSFAGHGRREPVTNLSVTVLVVVWVGVLGSYAGLLLAPATFPHRHGVDIFFAAIAVTVGHDVGSYLLGSRLGRHRLAPKLSPGKSVEGLIGGTVGALVIAIAVVVRISPFNLGDAIALAAVVSVFAPLGDLFESLVKRDLQLKDMGSLLPGHGGIFDRIDALLFVLPATYYLVRIVHFG